MSERRHNVKILMDWASKALEAGLARRPLPPLAEPELPAGDFGAGSPNQKLMFAVMCYVFALFNELPRLAQHRALLLEFLRLETLCHGHNEPLTASHGQIWIGGMGFALWAAVQNQDSIVIDRVIAWLRPEYALWSLCADDNGVWAPGGRGRGRRGDLIGDNSGRDKAFDVIRGARVRVGRDKFNLGARALQALPESILERIRAEPSEDLPPMISGLHIRRGSDWHAAWFDDPLGTLEPAHMAGSDAGERWVLERVDDEKIAAIEARGATIHLNLAEAQEKPGRPRVEDA
jgi:hypothetical protein